MDRVPTIYAETLVFNTLDTAVILSLAKDTRLEINHWISYPINKHKFINKYTITISMNTNITYFISF